MRVFTNLSIITKIYALLGALTVVTIVAAGGLLWVLQDADTHYGQLIGKDMRGSVEIMRLRGDLINFGRQVNNVLLLQNPPGGLDPLEASLSDLMGAVERSLAIVRELDGGRNAELVATVTAAIPRLKQSAAAAVAAKRSGAADHDAKARAAWGGPDGRPLTVKLYAVSADAADSEVKRVLETAQDYGARTRQMSLVAAVAIGLSLIVSGILAYLVAARSISGPLRTLAATMRRLADKDLAVDVQGQDRGDEVGGMAKAVQVFKENGVRAHALEAEAAEARESADRERASAERDRAAIAEQQARVVADLATGLASLAAGDLTGRVRAFPEDYRKLEGDFNAAIETLQATIRTLVGNGHGIRSGSGELSKAADDLSRRTEQQAASLEETAAALDEITATVRKTAEGAKHASEKVATARTDAEESGRIVQDAVSAMSAIDRSSAEMSNIIGVIDEIAFQTNLLALNAGVEAARAGESGKGFAVVASEVRALAQRSAQAAKEIKALIDASSGQVKAGVDLVARTGTALNRIATQVTEINTIVLEITASTQEQATALHQVNAAVNQMDQMTQQNAAMVEESTAASHSLADEAEQLSTLIARFRVGEEVGAAPSRQGRTAPRTVAAKAAPRSPTPVHGNLALKPEGWEEF